MEEIIIFLHARVVYVNVLFYNNIYLRVGQGISLALLSKSVNCDFQKTFQP